MTKHFYRAIPDCVLRAPLLPIQTLARIPAVHGPDNLSAFSLWTELAIAVASPSTFAAAQRSASDRHLSRTLRRYLTRMATRPTPFGLFSAVSRVGLGDRTSLKLDRVPDRTRSHPDMGWLLDHVHALERRLEVMSDLLLRANPLAVLRGARLFLDPPAFPHGSKPVEAVSVHASNAVLAAMRLAATPIAFKTLVQSLARDRVASATTEIVKFLAVLVDRSFLLTDLRPPLTTDRPAAYVAAHLAHVPAARVERECILAALAAAQRFDDGAPAQRAEVVTQTVPALGAGPTGVAPALHVETAAATNGGTLHRRVGADAARCAELLLRLSPWPNGSPWLTPYRTAFEARYGLGCEIPFKVCIDPELGIGPIDRLNPALRRPRSAAAEDLLASLSAIATIRREREIVLDEAQLAVLLGPDRQVTLPPSLDLFISVAASTAEAIDAGDYLVVVAPAVGAVPAGRTAGRFATLLETSPLVDGMSTSCDLRNATEGRLPVSLSFAPRLPRQANVALRPPVWPHEIAIDLPHAAEIPIPIDEIVIGVAPGVGGGLYARWIRDPRLLDITSGHMLNYREAPPAARLLGEIATGSYAQLVAFQWGGLERLPFLPRVRHGRCVLSPAVWRLTASSWRRYRDQGGPVTALAAFRREWNLPPAVLRAEADQVLYLELDDPRCGPEIDVVMRRSEALHLREVLPAPEETWLVGPAGRHAAEFALTLVGKPRSPQPAPVIGSGTRVAASDLRHVGSDWLFLKLYLPQSLLEDILLCEVRTVIEDLLRDGEITSWFFVRYADPDFHLRLRFHGKPEALVRSTLPRLCCWSQALVEEGKATRFAFESYEREVRRYGGVEASSVAEEIFRIDSEFTLDLLPLCGSRQSSLDRRVLETMSVYALFDTLTTLSADARAALLSFWKVHRNASAAAYRAFGPDLHALAAGYRGAGSGRATALVSLLHQRDSRMRPLARRLAEYGGLEATGGEITRSLLHMHCNRLLGIRREAEEETLGLIGRLAASTECRSRHANAA
jgi:lantibiotic biosynthesis protein